MVALVELAARGDRRRSVWIGLAVVPCVFVSVLPFADDRAELFGVVVRNLALCLLALAVGDIVRSRREAVARLVAQREEEALRRLGEERLRIARDVHDVVAHAMVAINVQAGVAAHLIDRDPSQAHSALRAIKAHQRRGARRPAGHARRAARRRRRRPSARPPASRTSTSWRRGLRAAGVRVEFDVGDVADVPAAVHAAGYRIVQEALTNVLRHARASAVRVTVARADDEVRRRGRRRRRRARRRRGGGSGNGLRGMSERAAALSGTLESGPAERGGWRVRARLPLRPSDVTARA